MTQHRVEHSFDCGLTWLPGVPGPTKLAYLVRNLPLCEYTTEVPAKSEPCIIDPNVPSPEALQIAALKAQLAAARHARDLTVMLNSALEARVAALKVAPPLSPSEDARPAPDQRAGGISARSLRPWPSQGVIMGSLGMGTGFRIADGEP